MSLGFVLGTSSGGWHIDRRCFSGDVKCMIDGDDAYGDGLA